MLQKFARIYTIVVSILILLALIGAGYCFFGISSMAGAVGCIFMAVLFSLMLFVTRAFVKQNTKKQKRSRFK
jgi:protein-S-isoprenylcysteine O-methyltransferase Ste14